MFNFCGDEVNVELGKINFEKTPYQQKDGTIIHTWLANIKMCHNFMLEPVVTNKHNNDGELIGGIVLVLDKLPDPDWTHVIVTGVSNGFKKPGGRTGVVFATTAENNIEFEEYVDFRHKIYSILNNDQLAKFDDVVAVMEGVTPDGLQNCKRIMTSDVLRNVVNYKIVTNNKEVVHVEKSVKQE
jgi:hypothetical protein